MKSIILIAPPAAGKGTEAEQIKADYNMPSISTGDLLRDVVKGTSEQAETIRQILNSGALVPDEIVLELLKTRISQTDCENGYILDGFPRNVSQAVQLDAFLKENGIALDKVINIEVDKEKLVARAVGRRICKACGATYHIEFNPSKEEGVCDICKGELYQRADDNEETVSKRIQVYLDETKPLADYYSKSGVIADIDGQQAIDKVFNDIVSALEG